MGGTALMMCLLLTPEIKIRCASRHIPMYCHPANGTFTQSLSYSELLTRLWTVVFCGCCKSITYDIKLRSMVKYVDILLNTFIIIE